MDDIELRIQTLVSRIEDSQLLDSDKDHLYALLTQGLEAVLKPVLIRHMDTEKLKQYAGQSAAVTLEAYLDLLSKAIEEESFADDALGAMKQLIAALEKTLIDKSVIPPQTP